MKLYESACFQAWGVHLLVIVALSLAVASFLAQAQSTPPPAGTAEEVTTVTELRDFNRAPDATRITETQTQATDRRVETRVIEAPSINGGYAPVSDTEQETVHVDGNTVRVVQRLFGRDPDGRRQLLQVIEEERTTTPGGGESTVRTVSNSDLNGRLQLVQQDIQQTALTSAGSKETNTTSFMNMASGFVPVQQSQRTEQRDQSGAMHIQTSLLTPDGNGALVPYQAIESTESGRGDTRTNDERVSSTFGRRFPGDIGDRSSAADTYLVQETVSRTWKDAQGKNKHVETYLPSIPGVTPGTGVYLARELSSTERTLPDGSTQTEQQLRQLNLGTPSDGLRVTDLLIKVSRPTGPGHVEGEKTIQSSDGNQGLQTIQVIDTHRSSSNR